MDYPQVVVCQGRNISNGFRIDSFDPPGAAAKLTLPSYVLKHFKDANDNDMSGLYVEFELGNCGAATTAIEKRLEKDQWNPQNSSQDLTFYIALVNRAIETRTQSTWTGVYSSENPAPYDGGRRAVSSSVTLDFSLVAKEEETMVMDDDGLLISQDGSAMNVPDGLLGFIADAIRTGNTPNLSEFKAQQQLVHCPDRNEQNQNQKCNIWKVENIQVPANQTALYKFTVSFTDGANATNLDRQLNITLTDRATTMSVKLRPYNGGESCHPEGSMVTRLSASTQTPEQVPIENISVGDVVETMHGIFEPVIAIPHCVPKEPQQYIEFQTGGERPALQISQNHYLYVNGDITAPPDVSSGDTLEYRGEAAPVTNVATKELRGAYHLTTASGNLVVNGYKTSVHVTVFPVWLQQYFAMPLIYMVYMLGWCVDFKACPARRHRCEKLLEWYNSTPWTSGLKKGGLTHSIISVPFGTAVTLAAYLPELCMLLALAAAYMCLSLPTATAVSAPVLALGSSRWLAVAASTKCKTQ